MSKILLILIALFVIPLSAQDEKELTGKKAPEFKLENINGKIVSLSKITGEGPVIISFWATWCKPCAEEMSELKKILKEYKSSNVKVVAISTDNEKSVSKVKPYIQSKGYGDFIVLLDTNQEAARKYYATTVPYSVIINKEGEIVYSHMGFMKGDEIKMRQVLDKLIK